MRKFLVWITVLAMIVTMAGCGSKTDYSNQTIYGKITAIDGNTVTMSLGTVTESSMNSEDNAPSDMSQGGQNGDDSATPPEMSEGDAADGDQANAPSDMPQGGQNNGNSENPPEMPEGDSADGDQANAPSDKPQGGQNGDDSTTPPDMPDGDSTDGSDSNAPSDMPQGGQNGDDSATPPEMPDGESEDGSGNDMPTGDAPQGMGNMTMYEFTESEDGSSITLDLDSSLEISSGNQQITVSDLETDMCLEITFDENGEISSVSVLNTGSMSMEKPDGNNNNGDNSDINQGSSFVTINEDESVSDESYLSENDDENALRVTGATVSLDNITVNKSSGDCSDSDSGNFYGLNAAFLATDSANVTITDSSVSSSAANGNGIFAYGSGTTVNVSDTEITTSGDNSGGIMTAGGGVTNATNLTIETSGSSSAAIRTDRGGGTVTVEGGTYTTNGYDSPAIYSTADITVSDATLTANCSEALVVEGDNSITLNNCTVSGNMSDDKGTSSSENVHNILLYQSTSGDADEGTSILTVNGGSIISNNGDFIHVTNTDCTIDFTNVDIRNLDDEGYLLNISGNNSDHGWGNAGSNGGNVIFNATNQKLEGNIIVDTISTLNMTISDNSSFTGTINIVDNAENGTAVSDNAVITIEEGCTWTLTGNCNISSLTNLGTINFNGYTITLADGTVLE